MRCVTLQTCRLPSQMVNKKYLGHICTAMMMNELEIIVWCFTIYCLMTLEELRDQDIVKYANQDELVLATAIFAKVTFKGLRVVVCSE